LGTRATCPVQSSVRLARWCSSEKTPVRSVLVARRHRAVGRQCPLGAPLEQSPTERPHAEVGSLGVPSEKCAPQPLTEEENEATMALMARARNNGQLFQSPPAKKKQNRAASPKPAATTVEKATRRRDELGDRAHQMYHASTPQHAQYKHRGALRGTPGSACPQPEPIAAELPSCAPISARATQTRRRWWWRGEEDTRRPGPEGQWWKMTRATMKTLALPSSAAPDTPPATSCVTSSATYCPASFTGSSLTCPSFTCSFFTCHLRASVARVPPLTDDNPPSAAPRTPSATSCVTSSATSCTASFTCPSLTCSSFTCHLRAGVTWVPPLADNDGQDNYNHLHDLAGDGGKDKHLHDEHLHVPVLRGAQHVPCHVLRQVLHVRPSRAI